jgi:hypothetical protein
MVSKLFFKPEIEADGRSDIPNHGGTESRANKISRTAYVKTYSR